MTKYCKDCKHYGIFIGTCHSPNLGIDVVSGENKSRYASVARITACGIDSASWFEPKPLPWYRRLLLLVNKYDKIL